MKMMIHWTVVLFLKIFSIKFGKHKTNNYSRTFWPNIFTKANWFQKLTQQTFSRSNSTIYLFNINMFLLLTLDRYLFDDKVYQCIALFVPPFSTSRLNSTSVSLHKKWSFSLWISSIADLDTFIEEISNGKLHFLCRVWTRKNIEHSNLFQAKTSFLFTIFIFIFIFQSPEIFLS